MRDAIRRYSIVSRGRDWIVAQSPDGEWVPFDQHQLALTRAQVEIERLTSHLALIRDHGEACAASLARSALQLRGG